MQRDQEVEHVFRRFLDASGEGDVDGVLAMVDDEVCLAIGTDQQEWLAGPNVVVGVLRAQYEVLSWVRWVTTDLEGYRSGEVGWVALQGFAHVPSGHRFGARISAVLLRRVDGWRICHLHYSVPADNEELLGLQIPTSLDDIAREVSLERPDLTRAASGTGDVTIMFTDIEASTQLAAAMGDDAWATRMKVHLDILDVTLAASSGILVKSTGDGAMFAFPDPSDALRFARSFRTALDDDGRVNDLGVRFGVHHGNAIKHANDFYGTAVNFAARVADAARGGETLVSEAVHDVTSDAFTFAKAGEFSLKGIAGFHPLYRLEAAD